MKLTPFQSKLLSESAKGFLLRRKNPIFTLTVFLGKASGSLSMKSKDYFVILERFSVGINEIETDKDYQAAFFNLEQWGNIHALAVAFANGDGVKNAVKYISTGYQLENNPFFALAYRLWLSYESEFPED